MNAHSRRRPRWTTPALLMATLLAMMTAEATAAVTSNSAAAIVAYPYLEVDSSHGVDTFVQLTNTADSDIDVLCFYENTSAHCTDTAQACRSAADCNPGITCEPGWIPIQFQIHLFRQQPIGWRVSQGLLPLPTPGFGSIPAIVEDPFMGALRCIAINEVGAAVASNVLIGHATVEQNRTDAKANFDVAKYNAVGLQAVTGDANGDGQLLLGGDAPEYQGCANVLILDHFFDQAIEPILHASSVQTTLALLPCSVDYSNGIPGQSAVSFLTTNEFGTTTAGDQAFAVTGQLVTTLDLPELQVGAQGTLTGMTHLQATSAGVIAMALEVHRNLDNAADQKSAARTVPGAGVRSAPDVIVVDAPGPVPTATPTPTGEEPAATATPTATPTQNETSTPVACVGDCDGHGSVTVDEILTMANIALGNADPSACLPGDANQDGQITVDEVLTAVNNALNGCVQNP
jgi:hypothetical protein